MAAQNADFLGRGLVSPLRRLSGNDFMQASGTELVRSAIRQIVGTRRGELRWRPSFGVAVERNKNKLNNAQLIELVRHDIEAAVRQFEPRVEVMTTDITQSGSTIFVKITWSMIDRNVPGNQVLLGPDTVEVKI